ncbi:DNA replication and repair protein RecN [Litoreibacter ascidiaceicola]|uniref:DNA repair protein RecN n=1 Tax=Litoreibacter ascidiaceicola TaxID=1486859 RepID=A0A1M5EHC3_9RHOB|nr:DNA repair protein RecN [Litoreibacter ascidiaceicola]SHF78658.1 DNA replication and repair protein RecN [Litoreibacter ascidiaceicola]
MLRTLEIRDMLIIDRLELEFQPGLNVLTGETGAGKSILLDSLGFVLGWRGRAELVRAGAEKGEVTAQFDLPSGHAAWAVLEDAGFEHDGELILRRTNYPDGRKQAYINDRRTSGELLRSLSETLVELHGQHDDRGILNPKAHREMLDSFAGLDLSKLGTRWQALTAAKRELKRAQKALDEIRAEEEFLRHAVAELDAIDPQPGQEAELDVKRRQMQAGERIRDDIAKALQGLGLNGAEGLVNDAARWLDGVADQAEGQLDGALSALERTVNELSDAQQVVEAVLDRLQFDPMELEQVEEQLFALRGLARKHDVLADDLAAFAEGLRIRLAALDGGEVELADLRKALDDATATYQEEADRVTKARQSAAAKLDKAMGTELAPLKMERAVFKTDVTPEAAGPEGKDDVSFTVATNPGAPSGPLNKIASGGELSRFLLALKVCLSGTAEGVTMIFDEIDRGVGGATADAVGRRLKSLADGAQVLVVTHSPQVAALGGHHWRVEKQVRDEQTFSTVIPLDEAARINEIARMVSGDTVTDAAKDAARSLLKV